MKYLIIFSPLLVGLSIIPVYIFTGKVTYLGYSWFKPLGHTYMQIAPLYVVISTIVVIFLFFTGKYVNRYISGVSAIASCCLIAALLFLANILAGLAMQGAGQ